MPTLPDRYDRGQHVRADGRHVRVPRRQRRSGESFYSAVLGSSFTVDDEVGGSYPMFTSKGGSVTGALIAAGEYPVGEAVTTVG